MKKDKKIQKANKQNLKDKKKQGFKSSSPFKTRNITNSSSSFKTTNTTSTDHTSNKLSELQAKFAKKLECGRFRFINETLYKSKGSEAFEQFQSEPQLFDVYHKGYREQVNSWPINPLDIIIDWIRSKHPNAVVADMGCGDARLASSCSNKVHSFDLVSTKPHVIACDIAHTPLSAESCDIVVFCLSLMGSNFVDFLKEAHRILKLGGHLRISEVRSRFENEERGLHKFARVLKNGGFDVIHKDDSNTMFFEMECIKSSRPSKFDSVYEAKACVYKKR